MTVAKLLQWPLDFVWPLLFGRRAIRAKMIAEEIAKAGELNVRESTQYIGFVTLRVYSSKLKKEWGVNIRPVHFPGLETKVFDFKYVKYIEFEYVPEGVTENHRGDPSTYLVILNAR